MSRKLSRKARSERLLKAFLSRVLGKHALSAHANKSFAKSAIYEGMVYVVISEGVRTESTDS